MHLENEIPQTECRIAENGEVINLIETLDGSWRIHSYECRAGVALHREGTFFEWMQGLPCDWLDLTFNSPDDAVEFAQQQMKANRVPCNSPKRF